MRVVVLISIAAVAACTAPSKEPTWSEPRLNPTGWMHNYDYRTELAGYLRGEYERARLAGATGYVYFYSDSDAHCLGTRRMMSRPEAASLLEHTQISMLNADRLKWQHDQGDGSTFDPGDWVPVLAKIAAGGTLVTPVFLPDLPLYHKNPRKIDRHAERTGRDIQYRDRQFLEALQRFLQSNNEI